MRTAASQFPTQESMIARAKNSWDNGICFISLRKLERNDKGEWIGASIKYGNHNILVEDKFVQE